MVKEYFGTDGIRGEVGQFPITPEFVMQIGYSSGLVLACQSKDHHPTVLIGKDTRISGYMLEAALQAGLTAAGVNVLLTGPLPTPAIAYLTRALRLSAGVMISASHNMFYDNGIKFFTASGKKLEDSIELEIEGLLGQPIVSKTSRELGRARRMEGAAERYIEFCKSSFPNENDLKGLVLVVDCAHGATYHIAPKVFHELGAEVVTIGADPDGYNINGQIGATHPSALRAAVLQYEADFGIALDGDGDRLVMADRRGQIYDGDQLLYVIAKARALRGELKGGVVGTVMTNMAMELALKKQGVAFERARVGDRYVLEMLQSNGWQVGGEASGHILCLDKHSTGDGIISALQVLQSLAQLNWDLADACRDWQPFPQTLINVPLNGQDWKHGSAKPLAAANAALQGRGRVVLRPSGTEAVVRVMVEADDAGLCERWAGEIATAIKASSY